MEKISAYLTHVISTRETTGVYKYATRIKEVMAANLPKEGRNLKSKAEFGTREPTFLKVDLRILL